MPLGAREQAVDVRDGELLAGLDFADGDGGVGQVGDAVVDAEVLRRRQRGSIIIPKFEATREGW